MGFLIRCVFHHENDEGSSSITLQAAAAFEAKISRESSVPEQNGAAFDVELIYLG